MQPLVEVAYTCGHGLFHNILFEEFYLFLYPSALHFRVGPVGLLLALRINSFHY